MGWYLQFGKHEETLRAQQTQTGKIVPALQNKPMLNWYLQEIMQEFLALNRRRQASMAALPLTPEAIIFYGSVRGWGSDLEFFMKCVSELDDHYLEHYAKKRKAEQDQKKKAEAARPVRQSRAPRRR